MTRSANVLAALASAALPGLDPVRTQAVRSRPGDHFETAFVEDSQERRWVVQAPRTPVAGALLEDVGALSALLDRRLDIAVPVVKGQVVVPEGQAVVYSRLPGRPLDFAGLPEGLGLAADLGRALAHIHNLEVELFEEAGRPTYDAETTRARLLSDLDRAAATGHVPTGLLSRWEHALEDVSLWRFLPTPVHGSLIGANVLATFEDEGDADTGRVRAVTGWEDSHVGDPAEDFADLLAHAPAGALESVLGAYAPSRIDRPDPHLVERARLASELRLIRRLLRALAAGERELVDEAAADLRALEQRVYAEEAVRDREPPAGTRARRPLLSETTSSEPGFVPAESESTGSTESTESTESVPPEAESVGAESTESVPPGAESIEVEPPGSQPGPSGPPAKARIAPAHLDTVAVPQASREDRTSAGAGTTAEVGAPTGEPKDELGPVAADGSDSAAERSALLFEIEEAEPLGLDAATPSAGATTSGDHSGEPDPDEGGVLDLHEGASEFVPVERRRPAPGSPAGS